MCVHRYTGTIIVGTVYTIVGETQISQIITKICKISSVIKDINGELHGAEEFERRIP